MGLFSSSKPKYSNGYVTINGKKVASNYKKNGNVYSNYNMNDYEKQIYNYVQSSLAQNIPYVNVFSQDVQNQLNNQVSAYTNQGLKTLDSIYKPILSNLQTDIANRFGNFDNSVFMDNLNSIESNRGDALSDFAQSVMAKQNELYNDELSRRYNYLNFLSGTQNDMNNYMLQMMGLAGQNSSSGNKYNQYAASQSGSDDWLLNLAKSMLASGNSYMSGTGNSLL